MKWIKGKIEAAWNYSRIIFINVAYALAASASEIISYLAGFEWDAFFQHEVALLLGLVVNMASVVLRLNTFTPVGASPEVKAAVAETVRNITEHDPVDVEMDIGHNSSAEVE